MMRASSPEGHPLPPESEIAKTKEGAPGEWEKLTDRFGKAVKWSYLSIVAGLFTVGLYHYTEDRQADLEYAEHLKEMSPEDQNILESGKKHLAEVYGENAIDRIERADQTAFRHRNDPQTPIAFEELEDIKETDAGLHAELKSLQQFVFTEKYLTYPKGWMNGEISKITYTEDENIPLGTLASSTDRTSEDKGAVLVYKKPTEILEQFQGRYPAFITESFFHETGHLNDWEHSRRLSLKERFELLSKIEERMESGNPLLGVNPFPDGKDYWQTHSNGTKEGAYRAAKEYWAELCKTYLDKADWLKERFPDDFAIVDTYAKKVDPSFDIFNPDKGAFDPQTGGLKDRWKNDEESVRFLANRAKK